MKKPWYIYAISFWSVWIVWSLGVAISNQLVASFDANEGYALALMFAVTVATLFLVYRLFKYSAAAYKVYGAYSAVVAVLCLIVALGSVIQGFLPQGSMDTAVYILVASTFFFVPSAFTAYICLIKRPHVRLPVQ